MQFKRSDVSLVTKARSGMLNLKNNFKGQFKSDVSCPQFHLGIDDENHVFTTTTKVKKKELNRECTICAAIDAIELQKDTLNSKFTCSCQAKTDFFN